MESAMSIELTVHAKDKEVALLHLKEEQRHDESAEEIKRLINGLCVHKARCQHLNEVQEQKGTEVIEEVHETLRKHRQDRYGMSIKLQQLLDEQVADVQGCAAEEESIYKDSLAYTLDVRDEICHLYKDMDQNRKFREEQGQKFSEALHIKFGEIKDALSAEARIRQESIGTLLELFGQMAQKMDKELEQSRRERHVSTDRIITIMETTLPKLDKFRRKGIKTT